MGRPKEVEDGKSAEAVATDPKRRDSGTHRRRGGIVDVVSQVGERLKDRQSRPVPAGKAASDDGDA